MLTALKDPTLTARSLIDGKLKGIGVTEFPEHQPN
jgi:hypothetical protein